MLHLDDFLFPAGVGEQITLTKGLQREKQSVANLFDEKCLMLPSIEEQEH